MNYKIFLLAFAMMISFLQEVEAEFTTPGGLDISGITNLDLAAEAIGVREIPKKQKETPEQFGLRMLKARILGQGPSDAADAGERPGEVDGAATSGSEAESRPEGGVDDRFTITEEDNLETDTEDKKGKYPYVECQTQLVRAKGGFEIEEASPVLELTEKLVDPVSRLDVVLGKITINFPSLIDLAKKVSENELPANDPRVVDPYGGVRYSLDLDLRLEQKRSNFVEGGDRLVVQARLYNKDTGETLGFEKSHTDKVYTTTMLRETMANTQFPFIGGVVSAPLYDELMKSEDKSVQTAFKLGGIDMAATVAADKRLTSPYRAQMVNIACFTKVRKDPLINEYRSGNTVFIFGKELPIKWDNFDFENVDFQELFRRAFKD